jgi:hypothetical protein
MSDFATQLAQVTSSPEYKSGTAEPVAPAAAEAKPVIQGAEVLDNVMAKPSAAVPAEAPVSTPPELTPKPAAKVKIGTQEFDSVEAAMNYANELELAVLQQDAFKAGQEAAKPKEPEAPKPNPDQEMAKKLADKIFENPEEAISEVMKWAEAKANEKIEADKKATKELEAHQATVRQLWETFYDTNQDLVKANEVVQIVLQRDWNTLQHMPAEKALQALAEKTRALLGSYKEQVLPSKELQSKPAITAGASGNATSAVETKPKSALDFISQINKHRKRETAQSV